MTMTDGAVILPGRGYLSLHDTPGTASPFATQAELDAIDLDTDAWATGWKNMGHTSRDDTVSLAKDGTDPETKGTWQKPNLRQTPGSTTWSLGIPALQLDNNILALYFGDGDITDPDVFHVLPGAAPQEKALALVLVDGSTRAGLYLPKVSVLGDDTPEFDPENFIEFSLKATVLDMTGSSGLMSWYRAGLGTP
jgi:hypothetical protein